jgi:RNA polymerase sigma-70 factor (ECF subfamily)
MDTGTPGPEEQAIQILERERLLRALAQVPEPYRSVVALVDLDGLRYAEAAAKLGCPRGTIMSRLHRGRLLLAEQLGLGATDPRERPRAAAQRRTRHGR